MDWLPRAILSSLYASDESERCRTLGGKKYSHTACSALPEAQLICQESLDSCEYLFSDNEIVLITDCFEYIDVVYIRRLLITLLNNLLNNCYCLIKSISGKLLHLYLGIAI